RLIDVKVNGSHPLADGDVIGIGTALLTFQLVGADRPGRGDSEGTYVDPLVVFPTAEWLMDMVHDVLPIQDDVEPSDLYISMYDTDKTAAVADGQRETGYSIAI